MKAVAVQRFGPTGGIAVVEVPAPVARPGQVLIQVEAIGVGGVDAMIRRGTISGYGFQTGLILGSEVAGTVVSVGAEADAHWIGERVWAFTGRGGAYAEQAVAAVTDIERLPEGLAGETAVALGNSGLVANQALDRGRLQAGESVLVRGAAGSIGLLTVQLAAQAGASTIAVTTSSAERGRRLLDLGATDVLDRDGGPDTSSRYDVMVDVIGGPRLPSFVSRLAPNGRMILVGAVAGMPSADLTEQLVRNFQNSLTLATFSADTVPVEERSATRTGQFAAAVRGELDAVVHDVLPLDQAAAAHQRMDDGEVFGRIVLKP